MLLLDSDGQNEEWFRLKESLDAFEEIVQERTSLQIDDFVQELKTLYLNYFTW